MSKWLKISSSLLYVFLIILEDFFECFLNRWSYPLYIVVYFIHLEGHLVFLLLIILIQELTRYHRSRPVKTNLAMYGYWTMFQCLPNLLLNRVHELVNMLVFFEVCSVPLVNSMTNNFRPILSRAGSHFVYRFIYFRILTVDNQTQIIKNLHVRCI